MTSCSRVMVAGISLMKTVTSVSVLLLKQMVPLPSQGVLLSSLLLHDTENRRQVNRIARKKTGILIGNSFVRTKISFSPIRDAGCGRDSTPIFPFPDIFLFNPDYYTDICCLQRVNDLFFGFRYYRIFIPVIPFFT